MKSGFFGVERLAGAVGVAALERLMPPDIAAVPHLARHAGVTEDDDRLQALQVGDRLVDGCLERSRRALAPGAIGCDQRLGAAETRADRERPRAEKPSNTTLCGAPMRAQASIATTTSAPSAGRIRHVTAPDASGLERRWRAAKHRGCRSAYVIVAPPRFAVPVVGARSPQAGLDVAIDAVVTSVGACRRQKPLVEGCALTRPRLPPHALPSRAARGA